MFIQDSLCPTKEARLFSDHVPAARARFHGPSGLVVGRCVHCGQVIWRKYDDLSWFTKTYVIRGF